MTRDEFRDFVLGYVSGAFDEMRPEDPFCPCLIYLSLGSADPVIQEIEPMWIADDEAKESMLSEVLPSFIRDQQVHTYAMCRGRSVYQKDILPYHQLTSSSEGDHVDLAWVYLANHNDVEIWVMEISYDEDGSPSAGEPFSVNPGLDNWLERLQPVLASNVAQWN